MKIKSDVLQSVLDLVRNGRSGALSAVEKYKCGHPYCSLVIYATDILGNPIFLFSDLSDHTANLKSDQRAALLIENAASLKRP